MSGGKRKAYLDQCALQSIFEEAMGFEPDEFEEDDYEIYEDDRPDTLTVEAFDDLTPSRVISSYGVLEVELFGASGESLIQDEFPAVVLDKVNFDMTMSWTGETLTAEVVSNLNSAYVSEKNCSGYETEDFGFVPRGKELSILGADLWRSLDEATKERNPLDDCEIEVKYDGSGARGKTATCEIDINEHATPRARF